jgi:hypothetical protein
MSLSEFTLGPIRGARIATLSKSAATKTRREAVGLRQNPRSTMK